jgi:hypothetical protein
MAGDRHGDGLGAAERAGLLHADADLAGAELAEEDRGDLLRQPLEEEEARGSHEVLEALADLLVVERILDPVGAGRPPDVGPEREVEQDLLSDLPFPDG